MNIKKEVWKDIVGYEGYYQVSNYGRIMARERVVPHGRTSGNRIIKSKILRQHVAEAAKYLNVNLSTLHYAKKFGRKLKNTSIVLL